MQKHEMTDIKAIAQGVREDIKAAIAKGVLPAFKTSVRIKRFSGGRSLTVDVTAVPEGYVIPNEANVAFSLANPHTHPAFDADENVRNSDSEQARADIKTLDGIVRAYNWDQSDTMTDYFHVNFYQHVGFSHDLEREQRKAMEERLKAAPVPASAPEAPVAAAPAAAAPDLPARVRAMQDRARANLDKIWGELEAATKVACEADQLAESIGLPPRAMTTESLSSDDLKAISAMAKGEAPQLSKRAQSALERAPFLRIVHGA